MVTGAVGNRDKNRAKERTTKAPQPSQYLSSRAIHQFRGVQRFSVAIRDAQRFSVAIREKF